MKQPSNETEHGETESFSFASLFDSVFDLVERKVSVELIRDKKPQAKETDLKGRSQCPCKLYW